MGHKKELHAADFLVLLFSVILSQSASAADGNGDQFVPAPAFTKKPYFFVPVLCNITCGRNEP